MTTPLPAHKTKHIPILSYPSSTSQVFHLIQSNDGSSNGTALWLGAQVLSLYLQEVAPRIERSRLGKKSHHDGDNVKKIRPKAIELGSGIGLTALTLASMGWDVLATDLHGVISTVLKPNVLRNSQSSQSVTIPGTVQVRELDWESLPSEWKWDRPGSVASTSVRDSTTSSDCSEMTEDVDSDFLIPPFDLIITADTLYNPALIEPLFRTLKYISSYSLSTEDLSPNEPRAPPIFLALENRDPVLIASALEQARNRWNFITEKISDRKIAKIMQKQGVLWDRNDWEGTEIWKLTSTSSRVS